MEKVIYGNPTIEGTVEGNASAHHDSYVAPGATLKDNAWVCDDARIEDNATVGGNAEIGCAATIMGNAIIDGDAQILGSIVVSGNAHIGGETSLNGEGYFGGFAEINSNEDYVFLKGLTPRPLTIYKSSVWGVEISIGGQWETTVENFLEFERVPESVKTIVRLIAQKWQ